MNHLQTLRDFNAWRRCDDAIEQPDPKAIGEAIDWAIDAISTAKAIQEARDKSHKEIASERLSVLLQ
jgi:hypothetical protein